MALVRVLCFYKWYKKIMALSLLNNIDLLTAAVAAVALISLHFLDPHHEAQHSASEVADDRISDILIVIMQGLYAILFAAVAYSFKGLFVRGWAWLRRGHKPKPPQAL